MFVVSFCFSQRREGLANRLQYGTFSPAWASSPCFDASVHPSQDLGVPFAPSCFTSIPIFMHQLMCYFGCHHHLITVVFRMAGCNRIVLMPGARQSFIIRGGPDDTWGVAMVFFPCANSPPPPPNQKQTFFFPFRQRNKQIFFPYITPFFYQFCEQHFIFYSLLNYFSSLFAEQSFFFSKKKT